MFIEPIMTSYSFKSRTLRLLLKACFWIENAVSAMIAPDVSWPPPATAILAEFLDMASGFNCERQINECTWTAGINKGNACLSTNSDLDLKCASSDQPWNCMSRNMHEILIWRGVLILWDFFFFLYCNLFCGIIWCVSFLHDIALIVGINLHLWPGTHFSPHLQHSPAFLALCCCTWGAAPQVVL